MTKTTQTQQQILNELHRADVAWRNARATERQRALEEADRKILAQKVNRDKLAALARDEHGLSWEKIAAAMGTTATKTAKEAAEEGRVLLPESEATEAQITAIVPDRFAWHPETRTLIVSLEPADLAPILPFTPWSLEDVNADPALLRSTFRWTGENWEAGEPVHPVTSLFFSPVYTDLMAQASGFVEGSAA